MSFIENIESDTQNTFYRGTSKLIADKNRFLKDRQLFIQIGLDLRIVFRLHATKLQWLPVECTECKCVLSVQY